MNIADHPVISEVQLHGGNANQDFVEIYNPTSSTMALDNYRIRKRDSAGTETSLVVISTGKSIPAHGFFLWANNQGGYSTSIGADENNSIALLPPSSVSDTPIPILLRFAP